MASICFSIKHIGHANPIIQIDISVTITFQTDEFFTVKSEAILRNGLVFDTRPGEVGVHSTDFGAVVGHYIAFFRLQTFGEVIFINDFAIGDEVV